MEQWLVDVVKENAEHISIINDELGIIAVRLTSLEGKMNMVLGILGFIGASIGVLFIGYCWKKIFGNNK